MNITNTLITPVIMSPAEKVCPRCLHHSICHIDKNGDIVSERQVELVACFINGCTRCAHYHGE